MLFESNCIREFSVTVIKHSTSFEKRRFIRAYRSRGTCRMSRAGHWELTSSTASKRENRWEAKLSTLQTQCSNFLPSPRLHQTASQSGNQLFKYVCPWRGIPIQISTLPKPPVLSNTMKHKTVFSLDVADCKLRQHQSMFLLVDGQYPRLHSSQWRNYDTLPRPLGPTSVSGTLNWESLPLAPSAAHTSPSRNEHLATLLRFVLHPGRSFLTVRSAQ